MTGALHTSRLRHCSAIRLTIAGSRLPLIGCFKAIAIRRDLDGRQQPGRQCSGRESKMNSFYVSSRLRRW
jgi:hypothetical protein